MEARLESKGCFQNTWVLSHSIQQALDKTKDLARDAQLSQDRKWLLSLTQLWGGG